MHALWLKKYESRSKKMEVNFKEKGRTKNDDEKIEVKTAK